MPWRADEWRNRSAPERGIGAPVVVGEDAKASDVAKRSDWVGLAILALSVALGVALVLLATATFIQMVRL